MSQAYGEASGVISIPVPWMSRAIRPASRACWWCREPLNSSEVFQRCPECKWVVCKTCGPCSCLYEIVRIDNVPHIISWHKEICNFQRFRVNGSHHWQLDFDEDVWEWRHQCVREWLLQIQQGEPNLPPWWEFPRQKLLLRHWLDERLEEI